MKVNKIGLAWIVVTDVKKAKVFFSETLGLKVSSEAAEYGWLELQAEQGDMLLGVGQENDKDSIKPGQNAVVTFSIDDLDAAKAELEGKGVSFIGEVMEVPGHVKLALFTDPDGNHLQLVQQL